MPAHLLTLFGEVLFDHFPDGSQVLGGAPFNVTWHLQALGQRPLFVSRVGQDETGGKILSAMNTWGLSTVGMQIDPINPTGTVAVQITNAQPSYSILDHQAYDYIDSPNAASLNYGGLLYHGSLALRGQVSRQSLNRLRQQWHGLVFIDINLRAPWWQLDDVKQWISAADWLKLNDEELQWLLPGPQAITEKIHHLQQQYSLKGVIVTCGSQGAIASGNHNNLITVKPDSHLNVVDTVGAGDAFTAVILLGLVQNWPLELSLQRAQAFASAIVGKRGATVSDMSFYQPFISQWELTPNLTYDGFKIPISP